AEREAEAGRLAALRDRLEERLRTEVPELVVNGAGAERLPHVSHVSLPGADRELLVTALDMEGIAVSAGSACSSGALRISHVLEAMGVEPEIAAGSVRFSLGRGTGEADVERAASAFAAITARLRAFA
ncbi:MAG: aminotransferase class V-fold PLP-dependent enzyme, partial [Gemmatimonadota bacterium]|nr:aminotransferase class V-fold PLP-dependent enzyme [Gemmatimonadota bacterium]